MYATDKHSQQFLTSPSTSTTCASSLFVDIVVRWFNTARTKEPCDWLHTCSRLVLETIRVARLFKKILVFYAHKSFINILRTVLHWTLSWARWVQSSLFYHTYLKPILILSCHQRQGVTCTLLPPSISCKIIISLIAWVIFRPHRASWFHHPKKYLTKSTNDCALDKEHKWRSSW
jgi:hypothetical protein